MANKVESLKKLFNATNFNNHYEVFLPMIYCFKLIGFWPKSRVNLQYRAYVWSTIMVFFGPYVFGQMYYIYSHLDEGNFIELIANDSLLIGAIVVVSKVYLMKEKIQEFHDLIININKNELFKARSDQQIVILKKTRKLIYSSFCVLSTAMIFSGSFFVILPLITNFPLEVDVPFINIAVYPYLQLVSLWKAGYFVFATILVTCYDLSAAAFMLFIACQMDLLADDMENLNVPNRNYFDISEVDLKPIYSKFHYCIQKHKAIVK